jgi:integrase
VLGLGPGEKRDRLRALLALLYSTGLRRAELATATVQSLKSHTDDQGGTHWELNVVGKGKRSRTVPIPGAVVEVLLDYFAHRFGERTLLPLSESPVPLLPPQAAKRPRRPPSARGINQAVSDAFLDASREVVDVQRCCTGCATPAFTGCAYTFATHAVKYDDARLDVLQPSATPRSLRLRTTTMRTVRCGEVAWAAERGADLNALRFTQ